MDGRPNRRNEAAFSCFRRGMDTDYVSTTVDLSEDFRNTAAGYRTDAFTTFVSHVKRAKSETKAEKGVCSHRLVTP